MTEANRDAAGGLAESTRVEAFSDGVLAIALTLLVLDLRSEAPRGELLHEIRAQWPSYVAYLAAFLNIASIWINHHDLFTRVRRVDPRLVGVNLVLLLVASLFPWPAAVVASAVRTGTHADQVAGCLLYAGVGWLVPLAFIAVYTYLARHPFLLHDAAGTAYTRTGARRSLVAVVVYPVAAAVAFVAPVVSLVAFVFLPAFFLLAVIKGQQDGRAPGAAS